MTTTETRLELDEIEFPADLGESGRLEWKALPNEETSSPLTGVIGHDDSRGTITAIVAVSGVPDKVGDVIVPGSLGTAVKRLKPKGVTDHNWGQKVSKLVYSEELMPGDPRLPKQTPDGKPWPAAAGGLLIKAQYNMDKQAGRDAYSDAKFYGPEECFSIGYKVRPGGAKIRRGLRYLHDYDIYEWSQVLHGAHPLATLTGVKSLAEHVRPQQDDTDDWYPDGCSGSSPVEGTIDVKALHGLGRRVVRDSTFWGLPIGTPIRPGMRPRGKSHATAADIERTTAPAEAAETLDTGPAIGHAAHAVAAAPAESGQQAMATGAAAVGDHTPTPAAVRPGVAAALAALHKRYQDFASQDRDPGQVGVGNAAIASMNMLTQFATPGADVHASPDGQFAAVKGADGNWLIVDTANAGLMPVAPGNFPPAQIDDALAKLAALPIPWGDINARRKRWTKASVKTKDQQAVRDILASLTPFDTTNVDTSQARYDAEGAIADGNVDDLADALTRMGLPDDQDPHDVAQTLLVLPSDVVEKRLDAIQAQSTTQRSMDASAGLPTDERQRAAHEAAQRAATGALDDHAAPAPGPEPEATPDEHGLIEGPDGELDVTPEVADRQDRVEALLAEDDAALANKTTAQLGDARKDLVAELALQTELDRRDKAAKNAVSKSGAPEPSVGGTSDTGTPAEPKTPTTRPGLAGAAEDLGDLLNAPERDEAAIKTAADRFGKLLAKHPADSPAFTQVRRALGDGDVHAAIASGALTPGMLFTAAGNLREGRRVKRNEQARARRAAKRIERDRIRSKIGAIDGELRGRGEDPETYGGHVEGVTVPAARVAKTPEAGSSLAETPSPPGSSASTPAPSKTRAETELPGTARARTYALNGVAQKIPGGGGGAGSRVVDGVAVHRVWADSDESAQKVMGAVRELGWPGMTVQDLGVTKTSWGDNHEIEVRVPLPKTEDEKNGAIADELAARQRARAHVPDVEGDTPAAKAQNHMRAARAAADNGEFDTAHGHLDQAQKLNPERARLWNKARGIINEQQRRHEGETDAHGADESASRAGGAVVPAVPPAGVRRDEPHGEGDVLRDAGGAGGAGDRAGERSPGGGRPAERDVRGEGGAAERGEGAGDGTGDAADTAGAAAPGLARDERVPGPGDTGSADAADTGRDRREPGGGDGRVQRRGERAGAAEAGRGEGEPADTAGETGVPEQRDGGVDHPVTEGEREDRGQLDAAGGEAPASVSTDLPDEQPGVDRGQVDAIPSEGEDFRPVNADDLAPAGKRAKLNANIAALEVLRQLQNEHRPATPDEQRVLARWAGWGGLPEVFDDTKPEYAADRERLRGLLSDKEWAEARRNTLNAHYTDANAVAAIWKAVQDLGFDGGQVLEPGSGSGTFIGFKPHHLDVDMVGVELDSTTAAISKALYPSATIRNESFADTRLPAGSMDAVVGNVPFGDFALTDRVHNPGRKLSIHNHFIIKSLAATKPGGICALLTSRYTMDSKSTDARRRMAEMGDLIGAVRLPTGSHSKTAGTSVIEDILIFRRREPGAEPLTSQDWINAPVTHLGGQDIPVNQYFLDHPDHVLGEMTAEKGRYGTGDMIVRGDQDTLPDDLNHALEGITSAAQTGGVTASPRLEGTAQITEAADAHDGYIATGPDGGFTQIVGGAAVPLDVPAKQAEELRALIGLRDTLRELLQAESTTAADTTQIRQLRRDLNDQYDAYVARYGPINRYSLSKTGSRVTPGQGGFRRDPMSAIVRALEVYDPEAGTGSKTAIFTKRAVAPREIPTKADTPEDALALSLDTYGEVNLKAIADMLGTDESTARERLGTLVFEQPPLTEAEQNQAWSNYTADVDPLGGLDGQPPALESVGESVRAAGKLEPAAAYLSGNVRRKLAAAQAAAEHDQRFQANVDALKAVIPTDLGVDEVDGRLGAAWIPADDVRQFLADLIYDGNTDPVKVATSGGGIWTVTGADWGNKATEQWGTDRISAGEIVQALLEQRSIKISDTIDGKQYPNLEATAAAQAKAEELQERFSEWLWEDSTRAQRLLRNYNNQFNAVRLRNYDDMDRVFPDMAEGFTPRPHQVAAVNRIVSEPAALLAHVVGAGKTGEMAMGAHELKRLGMAKKPAIVVPNHMKEQFEREYLQIYPNAKILAAGTDDLKGDRRREFVARAATGDWDCVILTQNAMGMVPMSKEAMQSYIDRELATMRAQLEAAKAEGGQFGDQAQQKTIKKMEKAVLKAEEALKAKLDKQKDAGVTFEQTGIDYLFVDEAHMYSNLRTLSNIQGAGATGSDMASDLHMKIEHLRANNPSGRVVTFASGTPIRNTVTQAYIMQRFLRPDLLEEAGIHSFDQWAATFGQTVDEMELKPEGAGFRQTTRFAKFRNVPELLRLFQIFADVKMADDLKLPTPNLETGAVQNVIVPPSPELTAYIAELGERAEDVRSGAVEPEVDNMLKISTDGRKAALSMALVGQEHKPGKVEAAADKIYDIWDKTKDRPVPCDINDPAGGDCPPPGSMQIVFADMGTPTSDGWNAYDALRDALVAKGMKRESIRFMHEAKNDREKAELFAAARNGQVAVLIGSTEKMGVGTNVQRRAVALHHLDAPWRPADVEQRDGRIMRQGNTNATVAIYRYVTEGSFDAYMWQTLERKKKFIDQIMRNKLGDVRELEDVGDTALSYAEVKALATGNPLLMQKAKVDAAVSKLARMERQHNRTQTNLRNDVLTYTQTAQRNRARADALDAAIAKRTDTTSGEDFAFTAGGHKFTSRADAADGLKGAIRDAIYNQPSWRRAEPTYLGTFGGHDLMGKVQSYYDKTGARKFGIDLSWDGVDNELGPVVRLNDTQIATLGPGIFTTLANNLNGFEARQARLRDRADFLESEAEQMRSRIGLPFAKADELAAARTEQAHVAEEMAKVGVATGEDGQENTAATALANARAAAGRAAASMGNWQKDERNILRRLANPAASPGAVVSPKGTLAAVPTPDGTQFITTADGNSIRVGGLAGQVDDPQALLNDLEALDIPWDEGASALQRRWSTYVPYEHDYALSYEENSKRRKAQQEEREARVKADKQQVVDVWKRHLVQPQSEGKSLLDAELLARAAQLKAELKADTAVSGAPDADEESFEDVVAADVPYVMAADGQLLKAVTCPSCGNTMYYPADGMNGQRACISCGAALQMQPVPATVG
jgi:N12 class adenine-specific DNA methylase